MNDLIQIIGFMVVMILMSLLSRKRKQERTEAEYPETVEDESKQKQNLKQFLKSLEMDMQEDEEDTTPHPIPQPVKAAPPPPPQWPQAFQTKTKPHRTVPDEKYKFQDKFDAYNLSTAIDKSKLHSTIENRNGAYSVGQIVSPELQSTVNNYKTYVMSKPSTVRKMVDKLESKKDMVIYQEIMNPPLSLRPPQF